LGFEKTAADYRQLNSITKVKNYIQMSNSIPSSLDNSQIEPQKTNETTSSQNCNNTHVVCSLSSSNNIEELIVKDTALSRIEKITKLLELEFEKTVKNELIINLLNLIKSENTENYIGKNINECRPQVYGLHANKILNQRCDLIEKIFNSDDLNDDEKLFSIKYVVQCLQQPIVRLIERRENLQWSFGENR